MSAGAGLTCETVPKERGDVPATSFRGLCLDHAIPVASRLAHLGSGPLHRGSAERAKVVDALLAAERGDCCPVATLEADVKHGPGPKYTRLGEPCLAAAKEAAATAYPHLIPMYGAEFDASDRERRAWWIALHADALILDAWATVINSWPTCPGCPVSAPPKLREVDRIGLAVLETLAAHGGGPLATGELQSLVDGLDRNNSKRVMDGLGGAGLVAIETRGKAKLYSLPPE